MQENIAFPFIPFGKIKSFGEFGPHCQAGQAARRLPDGDWPVGITPFESGEIAVYRLSRLVVDQEAY